MKSFLMIILSSVYSFVCYGFAISEQENQLNKSVKFELIVLDEVMLKGAEFSVNVYDDGVNSVYNIATKTYKIKIVGDTASLQVPMKDGLAYAKLEYLYDGQRAIDRIPFSPENDVFILQSGDKIQIRVSTKGAIFSGKGSDKYTANYEISKHKYLSKPHWDIVNKNRIDRQFSKLFESIFKYQDSLHDLRNKILESYDNVLSKDVYELLSTDLFAKHCSRTLDQIFLGTSSLGKDMGKDFRDSIKYGFGLFLERYKTGATDSVLSRSLRYGDYLFWRESIVRDAFFTRSGADRSSFLIRHHAIMKNYAGSVRQKVLLLNFLRSKVNQNDLALVLEETSKVIVDNSFKKRFSKILAAHNGKAYDFSLPDRNGKVHRLSDFRGKLVILDFWYTGCVNCAVLAEKLKPIIKDFKDDPNVVFISISIDGDRYKKEWLKSLDMEIYASKDEVNLLAQGRKSDIVKHYNIVGFPTLLFISKEGQMISDFPPDPRNNEKGFRDFLDQQLK